MMRVTVQPDLATSADLTPYVPRLTASWDFEAPGSLWREIEGTMVFVDLSGFTAMSERLAKQGKVGAEEVVDVVNATFQQLLAIPYPVGGELLKFGGDALLLFFRGAEHASRACFAAHQMRSKLREVGKPKTSAGTMTLRMSVGVHTGLFHFFLVGKSHRELFVSGPAATSTVTMEAKASAGEILLSAETAGAIDPELLGREHLGGYLLQRCPDLVEHPSPDRDPSAESDPAGFIPKMVREHLLSGASEPEHRAVSIAFLNFSGADAMIAERGAPEMADRLSALVASVQTAADEQFVTFLDSDIGKDGGKILLTAGAPRASENDEERMLMTLRTIIEQKHGLPVNIGVNAGRAFAGDLGPPYRRAYTVMGDVTNTAARVMSKAEPGELLATRAVIDGSATRFETDAMPLFAAKGKAKPIETFRVGPPAGRKERVSQTIPLLGREKEIALISESLEQAVLGIGTCIEIVGDAGVGKSRLVEEIASLTGPGRFFMQTSGRYGIHSPYLTFRPLLRALMELDEAPTADRLASHIAEIAPDLAPWLPLLAIVVDMKVEPTVETQQLDEQHRTQQLHRIVEAYLAARLEPGTSLVFEDVQWLDDASSALLGAITERVSSRPWVVCVTRRPSSTGYLAPAGVRIELGPLSASATRTLAKEHGARMLPQQLSLIVERSGGNPLFLQELLATVTGGGDPTELPTTVEKIVAARIDRLAPGDRTALRHLAVLGGSVPRRLAETAVSGLALDRLEPFLVVTGEQIRFKQALYQEAAYEGLPFRVRKKVHEEAGNLLEDTGSDDLASLSLHFHRASNHPKTWRYSRHAAADAESKYAFSDAVTFYKRALDAARPMGLPTDEIADTWRALGEAGRRAGSLDEAGMAYGKARRFAPRDSRFPELLFLEGTLRDLQGKPRAALRWYSKGLKLAAETGADPRIEARLLEGSAQVRLQQGKLEECVELCNRGLAKAGSDPVSRARLLTILHVALRDLRSPDRKATASLALEAARASGNSALAAGVEANEGYGAYMDGDWDQAVQLYRGARVGYEASGNVLGVAVQANNLAEVLSDQGHWEDARAYFQEALDTFSAAGHWYAAPVTSNLGRLASRVGDFEEATRLLSNAIMRLTEIGGPAFAEEAEARLSECLVFEGKADEVLERISVIPDALAPLLHRIRGYASLLMGDLEAAGAALDASESVARETGALYELGLTLEARYHVALRRGEEAIAAKDEFSRIYETLGVVDTPQFPFRS